MDFILHGYCGVYCGACPVMLATRAGQIDKEKECYGCKSEKPTGFCATCRIKACAQRNGHEFCGQCSGLRTCELMLMFVSDQQYPYGQCVLKNMDAIRDQGLPDWLDVQARRWRCKKCDTPHSWYHDSCPQCGQAVANYTEDL